VDAGTGCSGVPGAVTRVALVVVAGEASGVGKTVLAEALVRRLSEAGLRVAAVKHVHHGVDYRVKDTGRLRAAGARRVVAAGPSDYMVVEEGRLGFWEAVALAAAGGVDAVVVEGFREHLAEALSRGGCGAYIGSALPEELRGLKGLLHLRPLSGLREAAERLADMVLRGRCRASAEEDD